MLKKKVKYDLEQTLALSGIQINPSIDINRFLPWRDTNVIMNVVLINTVPKLTESNSRDVQQIFV